jgi:hypothetical protein
MKIVVCDFCKRKVENGGIIFIHKEKRYRIDISIYGIGHGAGIRASRTDACAICTIKYAIKAANTILCRSKKNKK